MRLLSAVLGFLLRKAGLLAAVVASLFLGYLLVQVLVPTLRDAVAQREQLEQVAQEVAALEEDVAQQRRVLETGRDLTVASLESTIGDQVDNGLAAVADRRADVDRLREDRDDECGLVDKIIALLAPGDPCRLAQEALDKAEQALDTVEGNVERAQADAAILRDPELSSEEKLERLGRDDQSSLEREVDNSESELALKRAEESRLRQANDSGAGWVVDQWARSWRWLLGIALLVLLMPPLLRVVGYFVLMPLVARVHRPIHLAEGSETGTAILRTGPALRSLAIDVGEGDVLSARSEHVRPVNGPVRGRLLYDWSSPFISFAAGLYGLSRVTGVEGGTSATLATPDGPDSYLMRIDFEDHPGVIMRPRHVVGVMGEPRLETRWRWGLQSFATWQVRYIMFAGTGSLIVQGSGDVVATSPRGRSTRMEQHLVMGFDSRLTVGVNRTEVFWPYLWGRTPLVDDEFSGEEPLFWQKSTSDGTRNPVAKAFDAIFSALGRLLGF